MSGIEGFAKEFLPPLIAAENCPLFHNSRSQPLCLIAMRLEFLGGSMRAITTKDHAWLQRYREPSQDWKIWITRFQGDKPEDHPARSYCVQLMLPPTEAVGPEYCNIQVTTLVLGKLCAHLVYGPDLPLTEFEYEASG